MDWRLELVLVLKLRFRGEMAVNWVLLKEGIGTYESDLDGAAEAGFCGGHFWDLLVMVKIWELWDVLSIQNAESGVNEMETRPRGWFIYNFMW